MNKVFGIGDIVEILNSPNKDLIGKESEIASVCGQMTVLRYHLKIDGEQTVYFTQDLKLIKRFEDGKRSERH